MTGQRTQANDAFHTLSAATPNAIRVMREGFSLLGSSRGSLDGRVLGEMLEAGYSSGKEQVFVASLPFEQGRDAGHAQRDRAGSGRSHEKAVDLVFDDFKSVGLEDLLLEQVASGQSR